MLLQAQNKVLDVSGLRKVVDNGAKSDLKQGTQCKISWEQPNKCSLRGGNLNAAPNPISNYIRCASLVVAGQHSPICEPIVANPCLLHLTKPGNPGDGGGAA